MSFTTPIGGDLIPSGRGWIEVYDAGITRNVDEGLQIYDVMDWTPLFQFDEKPLHMSGLLGIPTTRRVEQAYGFELNMQPDVQNMPEISTAGQFVSSFPGFRQLAPFALYLLIGNPTNYANLKMYYCPLVAGKLIAPHLDAHNCRLVTNKIIGVCKAPIFVLPDDGSPDDINTNVGAYVRGYLATDGTGGKNV